MPSIATRTARSGLNQETDPISMQLHIQQRKTQGTPSFDANPAAVARWVETLPAVNIGETARRLYEALGDLSQQTLSPAQRFKALELLRPQVFYVLEALKKHIIGQSFPLGDKPRKVARLARELLRELGDGYKILVMEETAGSGRRDTRTLTTGLHRAMQCLAQLLLKAYQTYAPHPEGVWSDIHQLYRYSETQDLHRTPVPVDVPEGTPPSSIETLYKQILLLALACPYRMRHGEAEEVQARLERWAEHSRLNSMALPGHQPGLFMTNLASDEPPMYRSLRQGGENDVLCRALDTAELAEDIRAALSTLPEEQPIPAPLEHTLRRLMLAWGVMPKRRFSRSQQSARVAVAMGLAASHHFISGEAAFSAAAGHLETGFQERPRFKPDAVSSERGRAPDVWELEPVPMNQGTPLQTSQRHRVEIPTGLEEDMAEPSFQSHDWHMINVSAGGYCLLWDRLENSRAQVGELVGIRELEDPDSFHWRLGVVRWMKTNTGLELGVQMLSPGAVAVGARPYPAISQDPQFSRALLLPEIRALQQPATLLLTAPPFRVGGSAIINSHGREVKVKLHKMVENTGSFAQFQFVTVEETERAARNPFQEEQEPVSASDLDEVWELL
jgi:cyclic-di-GMP-binding protein